MTEQIFYTGVVEDIMDPLKLGRCRVRVIGVHTEDKQLLPTSDLPWATPIMPITSASMNGIGSSPTGLVCGSWVIVFFTDTESKQQPMLFGSIVGLPSNVLNSFDSEDSEIKISSVFNDSSIFPQEYIADELKTVDPIEQLILSLEAVGAEDVSNGSDSQSENFLDSQATPKKSVAVNPVKWKLGQTSGEFESSNLGPGTINDYNKTANWDMGGASYGTYQFASFLPPMVPTTARKNAGKYREKTKPSPVQEFLANSKYKELFEGLTPATKAFDDRWKLVGNQYKDDFAEEQRQFIKKKYYDPVISLLKARGLNFNDNGPAVHDAIWSTSVQFWHPRTVKLISDAIGARTRVSDIEFVNLVYDLKAQRFPSESSRVSKEKQKLLSLARSGATRDGLLASNSTAKGTSGVASVGNIPSVRDDSAQDFGLQEENISEITRANYLGFTDPAGKYPLKTHLNEPDTNRLARNDKIDQTIVDQQKRNLTVGVVVANNGGTWNQPDVPYASKYPHNHVTQSESGHVIQVDDTPGAERIQVYHRAGTFVEIDNNGTMVRKIVGDGYEIVERNGNIFVGGTCNLTVGGSINIYSYGNTNVETTGDTNITCYNDISVKASGSIDVSAKETLSLKANKVIIDSDTSVDILANTNIVATAKLNIDVSSTNYSNKAKSDYKVSANGEAWFRTGGDTSFSAKNILGDAEVVSLQNKETKAKDFVGVVSTGASFGVTGEARRDANTAQLEPLAPNTRIEASAYHFETSEDTDNSEEFSGYVNNMISSGSATGAQINAKPVEVARDQTTNVGSHTLIPVDIETIRSMDKYPDSLRLSPNFTLGQVSSRAAATQNSVRAQYGISTADAVANLQNLCLNVLEPIFRKYPNMIVTSGFRHKNSGSKISDHVLGQAVDLQFPGASKSDYFQIAQEIKKLVSFKQLLLEYKNFGTKNPWIHVALSRVQSQNRNQIMTFFNHKKHSDGLSKLA